MAAINHGPCSPRFTPLFLNSGTNLSELGRSSAAALTAVLSRDMTEGIVGQARDGTCVSWGIPFEIDKVVVLVDQSITIEIEPTQARWLVFLHTSDVQPLKSGPGGIISPMPGAGRLAEHAADYMICYADGSQVQSVIRRRYQLGSFQRRWGENCFEAVAHRKPCPTRTATE